MVACIIIYANSKGKLSLGLTEKLGDIKLKKHAGDCLVAFAEKTSLQFVLSQGTM
jgi:hypothetical protein